MNAALERLGARVTPFCDLPVGVPSRYQEPGCARRPAAGGGDGLISRCFASSIQLEHLLEDREGVAGIR